VNLFVVDVRKVVRVGANVDLLTSDARSYVAAMVVAHKSNTVYYGIICGYYMYMYL